MIRNVRRVVLDTNTFVSATLLGGSIPEQAVEKAFTGDKVLRSDETLSELREVLLRSKFDRYRSLEFREAFLAKAILAMVQIDVRTHVPVCRHKKDDKFLELAVDGQADLIITGDSDLLVLNPFRGIEIITPAAYLVR